MARKPLKEPVPLDALLESAFERLGHGRSFARHKVLRFWPRIVGKVVAGHTVAEKVTGSVLHVAVDSSGWMNELAAMKNVLLEKIGSCLEPGVAPITEIRFRQRSWARKKSVPEPLSEVPEPTEEDLRLVRKTLEPLQDEELREIFERVMEKDRRLKHRRASGK
jgi:predicted nucleic acid-binding Zn ribbon protein